MSDIADRCRGLVVAIDDGPPPCDAGPLSRAAIIARARGVAADAAAEIRRLRAVCQAAWEHVEELRDAWERGAIHERDTLGGTRSNRNADIEVRLRKVLEQEPEP